MCVADSLIIFTFAPMLGSQKRMRRVVSGFCRTTVACCCQQRTIGTASSSSKHDQELARDGAVAAATKRDIHAMPSIAERPSSPLSSSSSHQVASGGASKAGDHGFDSQGGARDWTEPSLSDLDRSIPQVDCKFIADLIRTRNARRQEFLRAQKSIKDKLTEMVRSRNLSETAQVEDALVKELSPEETEILSHTRPEYDDGFVLIDCRTVNEVTSWGIIEGAKVLPAHEMFEAFHMTPDVFETEYGFPKPRPEETVIFYCQYGPRSLMAAQILSWMGYTNVLHFRDGYHEWGKQYNLLVRRWMEHDKTSGNDVRRLVAFEASRQLQREIAPEFNALPLQEMERYLKDETRSPGTLKVGENVRTEALRKLAGVAVVPPPQALPGTVDDGIGMGQSRTLHAFMSSATGVRPVTEQTAEDGKPMLSMGEAQQKVREEFQNLGGVGGTNIADTKPQ